MSGPQPSEEDSLLGVVLGERYRIVSCLSRGGMGVVYKAQHTVLDKPLAIKVMLQTQDEAARQRFMQEAKLASSVQHPNIVGIIDFGVLPSQKPYLVMELLVGQTLADAIFVGPLSPARTCHIAAQVARGLHAVHQKGIIHRDLKPANIILMHEETTGQTGNSQLQDELVKVVDFGVATVVSKEGSGQPGSGHMPRLTTPGMVLGTAEYMSPEQAQGLKTDHRVDQYALGCIMYEMLTCRVPFQGPTPAATMLKHLTEKPTPMHKLRPQVPSALERVVQRAMSLNPAQRFPSMLELAQELTAVLEQERSPATLAATQKLPRSLRSGRAQLMLGAGLGMFLVGLVTLVTALRRSPPAPAPALPPSPPIVSVSDKSVRPATVSWSIKSEPSGAAVVRVADGKTLGKTPLRKEMPLGEGTTAVELRLEGYQPATIALSNAGDDAPKRMHLQPIAQAKDKSAKKTKAKRRSGAAHENEDSDASK